LIFFIFLIEYFNIKKEIYRMWKIKDSLPIKAGILKFEGLSITHDKTAYLQIIKLGLKYESEFKKEPVSQIPGIQNARDFFRAVGIDPTKRRPSSEALLRRALNSKGFFQVNTLVDTANYCSLDFLLPICVYDAAKIDKLVEIRKGKKHESYQALTGKELNLAGRYVIADEKGAFGSPITDSIRSAVSKSTSSAFICIFAPGSFPDSILSEYMNIASNKVTEICAGKCSEKLIIQG